MRKATPKGFTLVELLVVIGIIAILLGILLPVLGKVRQQSIAVRCAANLHNFGQAWHLYADRAKGMAVPGRLERYNDTDSTFEMGSGLEYRPRWYELLGASMQIYATNKPKTTEDDSWDIDGPQAAQFLCGAVADWTNSRNYCYGYNYQFLGNARKRPDGKWIKYPVNVGRINGSGTVMAMDSLGTAAGRPTAQRNAYYPDGTKDIAAQGNKGWAIDPPRLTAKSDYADPQRPGPENRSGPDPRHSGKVNVVFCDAHVEALTLHDLGYVVNPDGSYAAMDSRATNARFSGAGTDEDPPAAK